MSRRSPEALNAKLMMLVAEAGPARVARLRRAPCSLAEAEAALDALLGPGPERDHPGWPEAGGHAPAPEVAYDGGGDEAAPGETAWSGDAAPEEDAPADAAWAGESAPEDGAPADAAWAGESAPEDGAPADTAWRDDVDSADPAPVGDDASRADDAGWTDEQALSAEPTSAGAAAAWTGAAAAIDVPVHIAWDAATEGASADFDDIAVASRDAFTAPPVADELALAEEVRDLGEDDVPSGPPADEADRAGSSRDSGLLSSVKKLFRK